MRSWEICGFDGGTAEEFVEEELFCLGKMGLAFEMATKARAALKSFMSILSVGLHLDVFCSREGLSSLQVS